MGRCSGRMHRRVDGEWWGGLTYGKRINKSTQGIGAIREFGRKLSDSFMEDLKNGVLRPLLTRIKEDDTLMLGPAGKLHQYLLSWRESL